jgi:hypothetical protein
MLATLLNDLLSSPAWVPCFGLYLVSVFVSEFKIITTHSVTHHAPFNKAWFSSSCDLFTHNRTLSCLDSVRSSDEHRQLEPL